MNDNNFAEEFNKSIDRSLLKKKVIKNSYVPDLMELFKCGNNRQAQNAAYYIYHIIQTKPTLIQPYAPGLIDHLKHTQSNTYKRNTMKIFELLDIPEEKEGELLELAFLFLNNMTEPVATKVFSMSVILRLVKKYPELSIELKNSIDLQLPFASPGFISRGKKVLDALTKI